MFRRNRSTTNGNGRQRTASFSSAFTPSRKEPLLDVKSPISSTDYARKCKDLMEIYRDLLDLGASFPFDLPRVVVVGGQSGGKSSLVEAVSGINVPRDSGTCTRCPMICTMSSTASTWSCTIELSYEFDQHGDQKAASLPESFGPVIENKASVELWIRRAQAAILSPHRPRSLFLGMSDTELRNNARTDPDILPFSKNSVRVNVQDPSATDLSFVDLPGLIQNADEALIDMVRTLVEGYIAGQNTLIVIAMPMSDDIEMMQAIVLAGHADPERERTIGVLTKPDTLTKGAIGGREKWKSVIEGRERATKHGYYCVRLPDDDERERRITAFEAQRNAANFFDSTPPWSQIHDRSRFGIPNFVTNISALLVKLIEKNLKGLKEAVEAELRKCLQDISGLPPVANVEPSTEIILRVNAFCRDIVSAVRGENFKYFVQRNKARYLKYKEEIVATTPDFRPFENVNDRFSLPLVVTETEPRDFPYVRDAIAKSITWELSGVPFEAIKTLVVQYTDLWAKPSSSCFDALVDNMHDFVKGLTTFHFGQYKALEKYVNVIIAQESHKYRDKARDVVEKILKLETDPLFTQNFDALRTEETRWFGHYQQESNKSLTSSHNIPHAVALDYHFSDRPDITIEAQRTWSLNDELKVMAGVQAYFQVAHKRIIDYVPLAIEHELNQSFSSAIESTLLNNIFNDTEGGRLDVHGLLKEDPDVERKRTELRKRESRLRQIREKLQSFDDFDHEAPPPPTLPNLD